MNWKGLRIKRTWQFKAPPQNLSGVIVENHEETSWLAKPRIEPGTSRDAFCTEVGSIIGVNLKSFPILQTSKHEFTLVSAFRYVEKLIYSLAHKVKADRAELKASIIESCDFRLPTTSIELLSQGILWKSVSDRQTDTHLENPFFLLLRAETSDVILQLSSGIYIFNLSYQSVTGRSQNWAPTPFS
jgi:hypothetical protein